MPETKPEGPATKTPTPKTDKPRTRAKAAPAPKAGTVLEREYKGKSYRLTVTSENGAIAFRLGKKKYSSLTEAAKEVTGYASISGPAFWGKANA